MTANNKTPLYKFLKPSNTHIWILFALLKVNSFLPHLMQINNGKFLGRVLHKFLAKRRAISRKNLSLAFPNLKREKIKRKLEHTPQHRGITSGDGKGEHLNLSLIHI